MAVMLVPAAAVVGGALALGRHDLALGGLARGGLDLFMLLAAGVAVVGYKRFAVHRRGSLRV
jgi:hypothetical protein